MRWSLFALLFAACGARTELRTGAGVDASTDASASDASHDAHGEDAPIPTCAAGLVQLATTAVFPDEIALDHGYVYWHDETGIFRVKATGGASELVADGVQYFFPNLSAFAIADGHVFYGGAGDGVWRAPLYSSEPSILFAHVTQSSLAASTSHVFVWSHAAIDTTVLRYDFSVQAASGSVYLQHTPSEAAFPTVGETAYFASDPDIIAIDFSQAQLVSLSGLPATDIVLDGTSAYFTSADATNGARVMTLVLSSLATKPIPDTDGAFALAQDATNLFFTDGKNLRVRRIEQKTGPVSDVASTAPFAPMDLVVDDTCVYWTSAPKGGSAGAIMAAPKH